MTFIGKNFPTSDNNISNKQQKYIQSAFIQSLPENSYEHMDFNHGCVAVMSGKIIAEGRNSSRTCSKDGFIFGCSCHAEIATLRNIHKMYSKQNNLRKMRIIYSRITLYIVRYNKDHFYANSAPCVLCTKKIKELGVKKLVYCNQNHCFNITKTKDYFTDHYSGCCKRFMNINSNNSK